MHTIVILSELVVLLFNTVQELKLYCCKIFYPRKPGLRLVEEKKITLLKKNSNSRIVLMTDHIAYIPTCWSANLLLASAQYEETQWGTTR